MARPDTQRLREILEDGAFLDAVSRVRDSITKTVMHSATTHEARDRELAEYHALDRVLKRLRTLAETSAE